MNANMTSIPIQSSRLMAKSARARTRTPLGTIYQYSRYNVAVELEDGRLVIYNTSSHILSALTLRESVFYRGVLEASFETLTQEEHGYLDELLINNFVVPADADEVGLVEQQYNRARASQDQMVLTITPTLYCNMSCHYCFQGQIKDKEVMSEETQDATMAYIQGRARADLGVKNFGMTWFGGEPLLGLNVIKNLSDRTIAWCERQGIGYSASMITNGFLLNKKTAGELYSRRVRTVQITLDGERDTHNLVRHLRKSNYPSFDVILGNIASYASEYPIQTLIRVNVDQTNAETIFRLIEQMAEVGLARKNVSIYFAPVVASTSSCRASTDQTLEVQNYSAIEFQLYKAALKVGLATSQLPPRFMGICGAMKPKGFVIVANGDIHKCWETVTFPERRMGHVSQPPTEKDLATEKMWDSWSPFTSSGCRDCFLVPSCAGFCPYKYLYKSEFSGKSGELPCPSLKFNIKDRILDYARMHNMF